MWSVLKAATVNTRAVYLYKPEFTVLDTPFPIQLHAQLLKAQKGNVALVTLPVLWQHTQGLVDWIPYLVAICILSNNGITMTTEVADLLRILLDIYRATCSYS